MPDANFQAAFREHSQRCGSQGAEGILGGGSGAQSSRDGEQLAMSSNGEGSSGSQSAEIRIDASRPPDAQARQRDLIVRLAQATGADAIGLLMRSERHRHYSLADLEWLLLPPLLLNQFRLSCVRPQIAKRLKTGGAADTTVVGDLPPMAVAMVSALRRIQDAAACWQARVVR